MDFSTIRNQIKAKNVPEICANVSLVFENAIKYNDERSNVHMMAKTLLEKFEEKWMQLLPKVNEVVVVIPRKLLKLIFVSSSFCIL